ncbi:hypothetical protein K469DRAFT_257345 [Zopfia rhizophila CBS 207.26]|uniref:Uncharacterized protein n=1 Tax=Zopfia rhizophila CBS 207.26 TaxID=1314779 RepID=A0A6A6DU96_9PEZI|nr:hypothetical protein K469DRAFT_257345 [Zopfia rhizophila CBS 207.26]
MTYESFWDKLETYKVRHGAVVEGDKGYLKNLPLGTPDNIFQHHHLSTRGTFLLLSSWISEVLLCVLYWPISPLAPSSLFEIPESALQIYLRLLDYNFAIVLFAASVIWETFVLVTLVNRLRASHTISAGLFVGTVCSLILPVRLRATPFEIIIIFIPISLNLLLTCFFIVAKIGLLGTWRMREERSSAYMEFRDDEDPYIELS